MRVLVAGATGATGKLLVKQLLAKGTMVRAIVRSPGKLTESVGIHPHLELIEASISRLKNHELEEMVADCEAIAICLGHVPNLKGIYGSPRKLVSDTTERLCNALHASRLNDSTRLVLMNTSGNRYRDLGESLPLNQRLLVGFLRFAMPPHADNERAAGYLRNQIGTGDPAIEWVAVRPDSLVDEPVVTEYELYPSPITRNIFNPLSTSRINVAHFMAELLTGQAEWNRWKGRLPLIYNSDSVKKQLIK
jgi:nucleoside-diphosphate-sugar epimerase